jgi:hypothetical protein
MVAVPVISWPSVSVTITRSRKKLHGLGELLLWNTPEQPNNRT